MQRRQVRRLRIRQLLLLIVRMLIILMVVLAFARPTVETGGVGSHAAVSAAIVLDNSASMNRYVTDGNLFELAHLRTSELIETFGEADQIQLLPLDRTGFSADASPPGSPASVLEQLRNVRAGSSLADLEGGLENADDFLSGASNLNKEIYIISDRQRRSLPNQPVLADSDARTHLIELPFEPDGNVGIISVDFGGQLLIPGHNFEIAATIRNYGREDQSDLIASLFLDGNRIAQTDFGVAAEGETVVRFDRSVSHTGLHSGFVEISDDRFMTDNRYFFSFRIPQRFNLLIVGEGAAGQFVSLALTPDESTNQYWSVKQVPAAQLAGVNFADYDVVVLSGIPTLDELFIRRLHAFVRGGRALFLIYDGEGVQQSFTQSGYYVLESVELGHPVFSVFGLENSNLPEMKYYTLPRMHTTPGADILARFSGNRPALIENRFGNGRVLTFAGAFTPRYSDMTGHAFFVPFISRIAEYLAADLSSYDMHLFAGDHISRSLVIRGQVEMSLRMTAPDSSVYALQPEEDSDMLIIHPAPVDQPGIYRITYLGKEIDRFAVNLKPDEADLTEVDYDHFAAAIGAEEYHQLPADGDLSGLLAELRFGKELWQLFLWAAVILIMIEILLSRTSVEEEEA